jgi:hypothetical protein
MAWLLSGVAISARYFLVNAVHCSGVVAACPSPKFHRCSAVLSG